MKTRFFFFLSNSSILEKIIVQNLRHSCLEIYSKNSFSRERKERSKNPVSIREFANTDNRQRSDCAAPATVNHEGLQSLSTLTFPLSFLLSLVAEKRFEAVGVFNVARCATARGHASYVPDNNDSVVLAKRKPAPWTFISGFRWKLQRNDRGNDPRNWNTAI